MRLVRGGTRQLHFVFLRELHTKCAITWLNSKAKQTFAIVKETNEVRKCKKKQFSIPFARFEINVRWKEAVAFRLCGRGVHNLCHGYVELEGSVNV